jgi:hypothetical protein
MLLPERFRADSPKRQGVRLIALPSRLTMTYQRMTGSAWTSAVTEDPTTSLSLSINVRGHGNF